MKLEDLKKVLVIGAGTMGHQIGFLCACHGYEVVIYDISSDILANAQQRVEKLADRFIKKGRLNPEDRPVVLSRMSYTNDAEAAAAGADLVTESVPENPELKGRIFVQFNQLCPPHTIFTTNTSTLVPSMFAEATGRPDRLLALHFHDIVKTNVVDVMPHPGTDPDVTVLVKGFAENLNQVVIVMERESSGYVFNAMLSDLFKSALTLASKGVAGAAEIDRAWMGVMGTPIGPFGLMDSVGLDTVWKINDYWAHTSSNPQLKKNAEFLKRMVDEGRLGVKTGAGFYSYPAPAFQQPDFLKPSH